MEKKRILVMVTEGPTDQEFYKKVIEFTKNQTKCLRFNFDEIKHMCAAGIGNMHKKMLAEFKIEICCNPEFLDYEKVVCFCYDLDVFKSAMNIAPIDIEKMKDDFRGCGADKIIEIKANPNIEDFFMYDIEGIKKFLRLGRNYKLPKKRGLEALKQMYKDGCKLYIKGTRTTGLVESLNMGLILSKICSQVKSLCDELGYDCNGDICQG